MSLSRWCWLFGRCSVSAAWLAFLSQSRLGSAHLFIISHFNAFGVYAWVSFVGWLISWTGLKSRGNQTQLPFPNIEEGRTVKHTYSQVWRLRKMGEVSTSRHNSVGLGWLPQCFHPQPGWSVSSFLTHLGRSIIVLGNVNINCLTQLEVANWGTVW